jgi:hypothetical protein
MTDTITKADSFLSSIQPVDDLTDDELRAKARLASGREPKVFVTPSTGEPKEFDYCFDDGSIFNVDFVAPGVRHIAVRVQAHIDQAENEQDDARLKALIEDMARLRKEKDDRLKGKLPER